MCVYERMCVYVHMCVYVRMCVHVQEKHSPQNYNLSCILTMPQHMRKGYGYLLVDFSECRDGYVAM